jgi:hypothetical protein
MRYLDEYRDPVLARRLLAELRQVATQPWTMMEVCGGQTHTIVRQGIDELLPAGMRMIHGPGCPVCVTPLAVIDTALAIAARPGVTFASFGDMLRVPGSTGDLLACKARGADVRVVYSPMDAVRIAHREPDRQVVFFAVGFETTAPANAMAVLDIGSATFTDIWPFGFKDHLLPGNELDVSDRDGEIRIANWPVYGMYQPDGFDAYRWRGQTLLVTANEGDARDWDGYSEQSRFRALTTQTPLCADSPRLQSFLASNDLGITSVDELADDRNMGLLSVTGQDPRPGLGEVVGDHVRVVDDLRDVVNRPDGDFRLLEEGDVLGLRSRPAGVNEAALLQARLDADVEPVPLLEHGDPVGASAPGVVVRAGPLTV